MGFIKKAVTAPFKAAGSLLDTLSGSPAGGGPNLGYFQSPEIQKQIDFANQLAKTGVTQGNIAQDQQIQDRARQIQVAESLGKISNQQAQIALQALGEQNITAGQQQQNIQALFDQAAGKGPSLALDTLKKGTDRNIAQLTGSMASQRGVPAGLAARTLTNAIGDVNQKAASDAATARIQEQLGAREQLAGALASERGAAYNQGSNASNNQLNAVNAQGGLVTNARGQDIASKQLADTNVQKQQALASNNAENQRRAMEDYENTRLGGAQKARDSSNQMIAGIGSALALSDEEQKKELKKPKEKLESFLDAISKTKEKNPELFNNELKLSQKIKPVTSDENMKIKKGFNELVETDGSVYPGLEEQRWDDYLLKQTSDEEMKDEVKVSKNKPVDLYKDANADKGAGIAIGQGIASAFKAIKGPAEAPNSTPPKDEETSDKNEKKDIQPADKKIESFLNAIKAHEYKYKKEAEGMPGVDDKEHISPMAQEFEKTEMGKGMVLDTPKGKVVDYGKGIGALFASLAHINEKIKEIEKKGK